MSPSNHPDAESSLRASWSIGPLRPWLAMVARKEIPEDLRGRVDASDVVQQTLLDAWQGSDGFRGSTHGQRLAWLRVILRRVILEQRRRLEAQKRGGGAERTMADAIARSSIRIEQLAACEKPTPDELVDDAEQALRVADALERLPADYRRIIEMRQFEHRSYDDIAKEIGSTSPAARMMWVRALLRLRQEIGVPTDSEIS